MNMIVTLVVYRHHLLLIMMPTTIIILTSPKEPLGAHELGKSAPWQLGQHIAVEEHSWEFEGEINFGLKIFPAADYDWTNVMRQRECMN